MPGGRDGYKADAVALLKAWLARAEAGEVISVVVVADLADGVGMEVECSNAESLTERLGKLRLVEHRLIQRGQEGA